VLQDEGQRDDVIHMRRQRRWLGSMSIPVRTIYSQIDPKSRCKVDGTFKIDVPFALVGYVPTTADQSLERAALLGQFYWNSRIASVCSIVMVAVCLTAFTLMSQVHNNTRGGTNTVRVVHHGAPHNHAVASVPGELCGDSGYS
jgi:hypothetical protein